MCVSGRSSPSLYSHVGSVIKLVCSSVKTLRGSLSTINTLCNDKPLRAKGCAHKTRQQGYTVIQAHCPDKTVLPGAPTHPWHTRSYLHIQGHNAHTHTHTHTHTRSRARAVDKAWPHLHGVPLFALRACLPMWVRHTVCSVKHPREHWPVLGAAQCGL